MEAPFHLAFQCMISGGAASTGTVIRGGTKLDRWADFDLRYQVVAHLAPEINQTVENQVDKNVPVRLG
jgi:extradiol dioxygenase family protein